MRLDVNLCYDKQPGDVGHTHCQDQINDFSGNYTHTIPADTWMAPKGVKCMFPVPWVDSTDCGMCATGSKCCKDPSAPADSDANHGACFKVQKCSQISDVSLFDFVKEEVQHVEDEVKFIKKEVRHFIDLFDRLLE